MKRSKGRVNAQNKNSHSDGHLPPASTEVVHKKKVSGQDEFMPEPERSTGMSSGREKKDRGYTKIQE